MMVGLISLISFFVEDTLIFLWGQPRSPLSFTLFDLMF